MADYFEERDNENRIKLREILRTLPTFCNEFFIGISPHTTALTKLNYAYDLRIFFNFLSTEVSSFMKIKPIEFEIRDLEAVTSTHLEMFVEYLSYYEFEGKTYKNKEKGKARKLSTVRALFKYFFAKEKLSKDVAAKISLPKLHDGEIIRLETDEISRLLDTVENGDGLSEGQQSRYHDKTKGRDLAILSLLLGTGIRVSECVGLNLKDIDFSINAFVITRKGGNKATLYFSDEVQEALQRYINGERRRMIAGLKRKNECAEAANRPTTDVDEDALFLSMQRSRITVRAVENLVKKYAAIVAPLKTKLSPHKLRSTYGTNLYRSTGDIYIVADVLGHRDVNTTKKHYAAITDDRRREAAWAVTLRSDDEDKFAPSDKDTTFAPYDDDDEDE